MLQQLGPQLKWMTNGRYKEELSENFRTGNVVISTKLRRWTQQQSGGDRFTEERISELEDRILKAYLNSRKRIDLKIMRPVRLTKDLAFLFSNFWVLEEEEKEVRSEKSLEEIMLKICQIWQQE